MLQTSQTGPTHDIVCHVEGRCKEKRHGITCARRPADQREKFSSAILPLYLRKTNSIEKLIPWLYLKGISTGDFSQALAAILGPQANRLSATTVTRLKAVWQEENDAWSKRSLAGKHYVYVWADGVHFHIRFEEDRQCILVLMGVRSDRAHTMSAKAVAVEPKANPSDNFRYFKDAFAEYSQHLPSK